MTTVFQVALAVLLLPVPSAAQDSKQALLARANAAYSSLHAADAVDFYRQYLALEPGRADVRVFLGAALLNLGQLDAAFAEAKQAIALDGQYAKAPLLAGRICAAREQWECAQAFFATARGLNPIDTDAWYFSGRAFYDANRFEEAITAFQHALRLDASQSRVYENLGLAQDGLGQFAAAEISLRKAVDLAGPAWRPYLAYGAFLFRQGHPEKSLQLLKQALALESAAVSVRFELARVLYHQNKLQEAAQVLELALPSNECRVHNLLLRIYSANGASGRAEGEMKTLENCTTTPDAP